MLSPAPRRANSDVPARARRRPRWRPGGFTILLALAALAGLTMVLYPTVASWISSYNQSQLIDDYTSNVIHQVNPDPEEQLATAREYNAALTAGVEVRAQANVPTGTGSSSNEDLDYNRILTANESGLMARIKIPAIQVDLPIYHGTSDDVLLKGAGHLKGSHLPIGGVGTHSVITAHRGLATATMFTNLDKVELGDTLTIEVFGKVLTYKVIETKVVQPEDTDSLRAVPDADLVTLITCTPLGVNSHRILVTAERITPTPLEDLRKAGAAPEIPGFPWWLPTYLGGILAIGLYVWRAGLADGRRRAASSQMGARAH